MKLLHTYTNGNYNVKIYEDGTKIRMTEDEYFKAEFPENIDIKISDKCDMGCEFCHEGSTLNGNNANFDWAFLNTLKKGTELAIGGGNVFENPHLEYFMKRCVESGIIANLTLHQNHFLSDDYHTSVKKLQSKRLLHGIGVSYNPSQVDLLIEKFETDENYKRLKNNCVIHVINGIHSFEDIMKLSNMNFKILFLGYKQLRRGITFLTKHDFEIQQKQQEIYDNMDTIIKSFKVVSFDNLAIEQINMKRMFTDEQWEQFYMGDDGQFTMYIDLVKGEYALNSTALNRFDMKDNITEMFQHVNSLRQ